MAIILGTIFGLLMFNNSNYNLKEVFSNSLDATGFQLGVFNDYQTAENLKQKYDCAVIIQDDDVYRVYYSILTNNHVIKQMESFLLNQKISFYKKDITISDNDLIKALNNYQSLMIEGNDEVLSSLNKLVMATYKGAGNEN